MPLFCCNFEHHDKIVKSYVYKSFLCETFVLVVYMSSKITIGHRNQLLDSTFDGFSLILIVQSCLFKTDSSRGWYKCFYTPCDILDILHWLWQDSFDLMVAYHLFREARYYLAAMVLGISSVTIQIAMC